VSDKPAPKTGGKPPADKPGKSGGFVGDLSEKRGYTPTQPADPKPPGGSNPPRKSDK
jgi:hypothetical protein